MAGRPRNRMSIEQRAKQFMPFAALRGLPEALARKEQEMACQMELPKEALEEQEPEEI